MTTSNLTSYDPNFVQSMHTVRIVAPNTLQQTFAHLMTKPYQFSPQWSLLTSPYPVAKFETAELETATSEVTSTHWHVREIGTCQFSQPARH